MFDRLLTTLATVLAVVVVALLVAANWPTPPTSAAASRARLAAPEPRAPAAAREASVKPAFVEAAIPTPEVAAMEASMPVAEAPPAVEAPLPLPEMALPAVVEPLSVSNHPQERNLNCEFRSAADLAAFYGFHFKWETIFLAVGHDPNGDPDVGFVGQSIDDPPGGIYPAGYGVHAAPIARGLRRVGLHATAIKGQGVDWLRAKLAAGHPVIIWGTAGLMPSQVVEWETKDGRTVRGVPSQHTFTAIGYDEQGLWLNDPWDGSTKHYSWERFERAWALLGQQAVVIDPTRP